MHVSDKLVAAVHEDDINAARQAIAEGADVNYEDEDGDTPLMTASWLGQLDMVKLLLEHKANPNHWAHGENPFQRAAAGGRRNVYEYLKNIVSDEVRKSADEKLLQRGELQRSRTSDPNVDDFIYEAAQGHMEQVEVALSAGADVNAFNSKGRTALHYAALYGHLPLVQMLLGNGANVDLRSEDEDATALIIVAGSDFVHDHGAIIRALLAAGADVDAPDSNGRTPIMHAVGKGIAGDVGAVAALLEAGADLNILDSEGSTAADIAVLRKRDDEMLKMLSVR